ncbi:membrane protein [Paenibacillus cisolokensis]|mgnify:CR=1 FL=1|jgi:TRAP-type C4-dicarboxylate transport system, small permease component|uniref:Membrane protein n=1 Tax=Paenibacillus cisolokensis TaxID=1658519 RepID=A0ABQ4N352_9BACL|nr:TRAP transporter small permease [Paenibacillus cisolokensis]GIQ62638.1 membrane protein [Paenibacillus cisolokensis]
MQTVMKWIDAINKVVGIIVGLILAAMSVIIIAQIFSRFLFHSPLTWSEEVARYLMVYMVFLGAPLALRQHRMIAIEVVAESVGAKARKVLKIATMLISIVFFIILLVQGNDMMGIVGRQHSAALGIPMNIPYMAIPIGAALMLLNAIAVIFEFMTKDHVETSEIAEVLKKGEQQ